MDRGSTGETLYLLYLVQYDWKFPQRKTVVQYDCTFQARLDSLESRYSKEMERLDHLEQRIMNKKSSPLVSSVKDVEAV
jgi:hypothetical protein